MLHRSLLIPASALAVSMTSTDAVDPDVLRGAGLTERQIAAFKRAREYQRINDRERARDTLARAGIDLETLEEMRRAQSTFG